MSPGASSAESLARRRRVLIVAARIGAVVAAFLGTLSMFAGEAGVWIGGLAVLCAPVYLVIPRLYRFGELPAPLTFIGIAYFLTTLVTVYVGRGSGQQLYFLVAASLIVLVLGVEHIVVASTVAAVGAAIIIALQFLVPVDTGVQPHWATTVGFVTSVVSSWVLVVATIWYAMREIDRAESALADEYERSESLLANILPAKVAQRLKDPHRDVIADRYDDASVLFADIAGFTQRASDSTPTELVRFLDGLYTRLDTLVDRHGLEKIKTSGDSYMVVSGVPEPRRDHLEALAVLALEMVEAVAALTDPKGQSVPLRIGLATGPVVAGVVGARKFFYDVWGDAVNVAARMESTDVVGRIQVPQNVYERLKDAFVLEERGMVDVKGKGAMRTWYLVGRRDPATH
ncbi:adenylate/guanylate cyclase domain-containing protein [Mycolicibacterium mucogenicum]|uniref:adenylate/guanylate cyclase domain-containing protein n=1 Tax=Mycolicibacterium mucogenicum TaxID=56689 RepID=UPI002269844F|nr:adenylate/guanylate cyclase domain-containing protein [Mycolicibacterium mucogenicum]MCX8564118.1 adenylate/guanylate cyclase domain-containing protein [Mycolicibacterium mucogenicum]